MKKKLYVGLDVHKDSISIAVFEEKSKDPIEEITLINEDQKIRKYFIKLQKKGVIQSCYEAGCTGYALHRILVSIGINNIIVAPGKLPRYAGDRVKTDKKDARKLGVLLKQGALSSIFIPSVEVESVKDYIRMREDVRLELARWKQRMKSFILKNGYRYEGTSKGWNSSYRKWLKQLEFKNDIMQNIFDDHFQKIVNLESQLHEIDETIKSIGNSDLFADKVNKLRCLKGIDYLTALTFVAEIGDFSRFPTAEAFMSFLGIVPGEWSSGSKRNQTGITKTGSSHLRRLLTEAAWHFRYPYAQSKRIAERRKGQPNELVAYADKCSLRLGKKYKKMIARGKSKQTTVTAIGRELSGFIWGLMVEKVS